MTSGTQYLYQTFVNSLDASTETRRAAESELEKMAAADGFFTALCQLLLAGDCNLAVKQAVAIYFKNGIDKRWHRAEDLGSALPIGTNDQVFLRDNILHVYSQITMSQVKAQINTAIRTMIRCDFPDFWPSLIEQTMHQISQPIENLAALEAGFVSTLHIISIQTFENESLKEKLIADIFPRLLLIANALLNSQSDAHFWLIKLILKSLLNAIIFNLPKHFQDNSSLSAWMTILVKIVVLEPFGPFLIEKAADVSDYEKMSFWKMKKWAVHCVNKFFSRYGVDSMKSMDHGRLPHFRKTFMDFYAIPLQESYIKVVSGSSRAAPKLTSKLVCLLCDFFTQSLRAKNTRVHLESHLQMLVQQFIFENLLISDADLELWEDEPLEYCRSKMDVFGEVYDPVSACSNLLIDVCRAKNKIYFNPVIVFLNQVFGRYTKASDMESAKAIDAALFCVGSLAHVIENSPLLEQMETFMSMYVLPELKSSFQFLKARACWVLQSFEKVEYSNPENVVNAYHCVVACLMDKDLPVRMEAAMAFGSLFKYDFVKTSIKPSAAQILQILMDLTKESDMDSLSFVMDQIIELFPEEIFPFACNFTTQLCGTMQKLLEEYTNSSNDADADASEFDTEGTNKIMTVIGLFKTIINIVEAIKSNSHLLQQVEAIVNPLIGHVLHEDIMDLYEDVFDYLETVTFNLKSISPSMWALYEATYHCFKKNSLDYLAEMSAFLDNVVSFGTEVFLSNEAYQNMLYDIIQYTVANDSMDQSDHSYACKLMESIMLNCRGKVDGVTSSFINMGLQLLNTEPSSNACKVYFLEVIVNALYYNASICLAHLEKTGNTHAFFGKLFENVSLMKRVHDKKLCILAINEVLRIPHHLLPASVQQFYSKIILVLVTLLDSLPAAYEERRRQEIEFENGVDDDGDENYYDYPEDDDGDEEAEVVNDGVTRASVEALEQADYIGFDDDDDDDGFYDDLDEEIFFVTTIDKEDPFQTSRDTLLHIQHNFPESFGLLTHELDAASQEKLTKSLSLTQSQFLHTPATLPAAK